MQPLPPVLPVTTARPCSGGSAMPDWLGELTAECPKKIARNMNDPCGAKC
jgi:hypothetical protein